MTLAKKVPRKTILLPGPRKDPVISTRQEFYIREVLATYIRENYLWELLTAMFFVHVISKEVWGPTVRKYVVWVEL